MKENIVIIDGSSLLYRAFYAIPHLTDAQGHPTNAVYDDDIFFHRNSLRPLTDATGS